MFSIYLTIVIQEQGLMDCGKHGYVSIWCMWVHAHCKEVCVWKDRQRHRLLAVGVWASSHQVFAIHLMSFTMGVLPCWGLSLRHFYGVTHLGVHINQ
jgi:hypothetical protein